MFWLGTAASSCCAILASRPKYSPSKMTAADSSPATATRIPRKKRMLESSMRLRALWAL